MEFKSGIMTTEFWLSAIAAIAIAALGLLVGYGYLTQNEADLWMNLIVAIAALVVPVAIALVARSYTESRTVIKTEAINAATTMHMYETAASIKE